MTLAFHVIGLPAPQGSKRGFYNPRLARVQMVESSTKVKPWRTDVTTAAEAAIHETPGFEPYTGPVAVVVTFYLPRPQAHYGTGRNAGILKPTAPTYCDRKPDIDKLLRSTLDALTTSGVFRDDAQVVRLEGAKLYAGAATGARIVLTPLSAPTSTLNPHAGVDSAAAATASPSPAAAAPQASRWGVL